MIHVDASFVGLLEVAGIGGVIRDGNGNEVGEFGKIIYTNNSLAAKILAILEADHYFVETHDLLKAIIYSDCQTSIEILTTSHYDFYANMINTCRIWLTMHPEILIKHCSRKHNQVAWWIAWRRHVGHGRRLCCN